MLARGTSPHRPRSEPICGKVLRRRANRTAGWRQRRAPCPVSYEEMLSMTSHDCSRRLAAAFGSAGPTRGEAIPIDYIEPDPFQPRLTIDEGRLGPLVASIRAYGFVGHLELRPNP